MIKWLKSILNTVSVDHFNGVTAELADQAHRAEQALRAARLQLENLSSDNRSLSNMLDKREDAFRRLEAAHAEQQASLRKCRQKNEATAKQLDRLSQAAAPAAIFLRENSSEESQAERLASALDDALNN